MNSDKKKKLKELINNFDKNLKVYKNTKSTYNEATVRKDYIDRFLEILGWDVFNEQGHSPELMELIIESYSNENSRPDYTLTQNGIKKYFIEAKKPSEDILKNSKWAFQARSYGWNANHPYTILTNFENLIIFDTRYQPKEDDNAQVARYRVFNYKEYIEKFDEIETLIGRNSIYSEKNTQFLKEHFNESEVQYQKLDEVFLNQLNQWRIKLSNDLQKNSKYLDIDYLNETIQTFINQLIFLRICEDTNIISPNKLKEVINAPEEIAETLKSIFEKMNEKYNSGLFENRTIAFGLNQNTILNMIEELYYPKSPYRFNIIEPNIFGKIYENFLTEQLEFKNNQFILTIKKNFKNKSIVSTPYEIVKYITRNTLKLICSNKTPKEILSLKVADISCGSGVFLVEAFDFLQNYCIKWYLKHDKNHLIEYKLNKYKLPFKEKKEILTSCIYGIDIDEAAAEVTKLSLLIKLLENESSYSILLEDPILPNLDNNIKSGNSLIESNFDEKLFSNFDILNEIYPFDWESADTKEFPRKFDAIIGNPPYVNTSELKQTHPKEEIKLYKSKYKTAYRQFDKYYLFLERALNLLSSKGVLGFIIPNKFFTIESGKELRRLISDTRGVISIDDFGALQLFKGKLIYPTIIIISKQERSSFYYSKVDSPESLWIGNNITTLEYKEDYFSIKPWHFTADKKKLKLLELINSSSSKLSDFVNIFNGIQTSAERPNPIYWFSSSEIIKENKDSFIIKRNNKDYLIEKSILKPYFKPTKSSQKLLNSYSTLETDKFIIFPYDANGKLISKENMIKSYPGTWEYLNDNYERLVPKIISEKGKRDVPNATKDTWYQYGRTQGLTSFINTPKLIVGILSKEPMYCLDTNDFLISSGGTAGYCAISLKENSPYSLEYIQAYLTSPITEELIRLSGSVFEGDFVSRGTSVLTALPFIKLDFNDNKQKSLHDQVTLFSKEIYSINMKLRNKVLTTKSKSLLLNKKEFLIKKIEKMIRNVYYQEFEECN